MSRSVTSIVTLVAVLGGGLAGAQTAPTAVTTSTPTNITATSARFQGAANPGGVQTNGYFRVGTVHPGTCNTSFGRREPSSKGANLGSGTAVNAYMRNISSLVGGTTYYYCAVATNALGTTAASNVVTFTTSPVAPTLVTGAASGVTSTGATLSGTANARGATTTAFFRVDTASPGICNNTFGTRAPATGGTTVTGTEPVGFSTLLSGLLPGTTYYFCAVGTNAQGTGVGALQSFTTLAAPVVTTLPPANVSASGADLSGTVNPGGATTTAFFRLGSTDPGTCTDAFGALVGATPVGSGRTAVSFTSPTGPLTLGATYRVCAGATNAEGTRYGAPVAFVVPAQAPMATTSPATGVGPTSAVLHGAATPEGSATTASFRLAASDPGVCSDGFGTATAGVAVGSGSVPVAYDVSATGLSPATTYWFCAVATNAQGTGLGALRTFTTPGAPVVSTGQATGVNPERATLHGSANPRLSPTTAWFRYATVAPGACNDTFGTRVPAAGGMALGSGATHEPFSASLAGLAPGVTYHYCALASNAVGLAFGALASFVTTATSPTVSAPTAAGVTATAATLEAAVVPNGAATTGWFRYLPVVPPATAPGECTDALGSRVPATGGVALGSGTVAVPLSLPVTALLPATPYWFCAVASNAQGVTPGPLASLVTPGSPSVTTDAATGVTATEAQLQARANPRGDAASGWFRYSATQPASCDDTFGVRTPATGGAALGAGRDEVSYRQTLTGLTPGTTYYYCALSANAFGATTGAVQQLTTLTVSPVSRVTALAQGSGQVTLRWTNPVDHDGVLILRSASTAPTSAPTNGVVYSVGQTVGNATVVFVESDLSAASSFTDTGLTDGAEYYYKVFNANAALAFSSGDVPSSSGVLAVPTAGVWPGPRWCYSVGMAMGAQPYARGGAVHTTSNARQLTANLADGSERWRPVVLDAIVQARPTVVPLHGRAGTWLLVGDQAGNAYAIEAATGNLAWRGNGGTPLGEALQAQPATQLHAFASPTFRATYGARDLVYFATRNASRSRNQVWALSSVDGSVVWVYDPGDLDRINGGMMVDYARDRLWIASGAGQLGDQPSLRVLDVRAPAVAVASWSLGDIDDPVIKNFASGEAMMVTNAGQAYGFDLASFDERWRQSLPSQAAGYLVPVGTGFVVSTTAGVQRYGVDPVTHGVSARWSSPTTFSGASGPRVDLVGLKVYVGDANGTLARLDLLTGAREVQANVASRKLTMPALDTSVTPPRVYVGGLDGRICQLEPPP